MSQKTAVILFNLGGPDSLAAVKPFLFNLFNDRAIIRLPQPLRYFIARIISSSREKTAQEIYGKIGGASPILPNTIEQAHALEMKLGRGIKCFVAMRHWHPFTDETARAVRAFEPDRIILLPLYPQFSTTTTASSIKEWRRFARKFGIKASTQTLCCYPTQSGFIWVLANKSRKVYDQLLRENPDTPAPRLLFSAHGLPEKIVKAGDPYQAQCEMTVKALIEAINVPDLDAVLCYQSRVGPLQWITPATDEEIKRAGAEGKPIGIVPIAFVSEHSETLVEIDMEYRHLAEQSGVPDFAYAGTVGSEAGFIDGLASLVKQALSNSQDIQSQQTTRLCPAEFCGCAMKGK